MPYITSTERVARQKGREEGREQAMRHDIIDVIEVRFTCFPESLQKYLAGQHDHQKPRELLRQAAVCSSQRHLLS